MIWHRIFGRKIPIVWQINDVSHVFRVGASAAFHERWHFPARRWAYRLSAQLPSAITVNVRKNQERVARIYRRNSLLYHCGVDIENDTFCIPNTPWRRRLRFVSTGIFYRYRNYETLLEVQFLLRDRFGIDSELTIIGTTKFDTEYADFIRAEATRRCLAVSIVGEVSKETMVEIYRASDLFLFLNLDQSWGLAIFEAMNWCLPVIVSRSVGATEILENEVNSIIVDPQDALGIAKRIAALQATPDHLEAIVRAAFKYVRGMTWENMYCQPIRSLMLRTLTCTK